MSKHEEASPISIDNKSQHARSAALVASLLFSSLPKTADAEIPLGGATHADSKTEVEAIRNANKHYPLMAFILGEVEQGVLDRYVPRDCIRRIAEQTREKTTENAKCEEGNLEVSVVDNTVDIAVINAQYEDGEPYDPLFRLLIMMRQAKMEGLLFNGEFEATNFESACKAPQFAPVCKEAQLRPVELPAVISLRNEVREYGSRGMLTRNQFIAAYGAWQQRMEELREASGAKAGMIRYDKNRKMWRVWKMPAKQ